MLNFNIYDSEEIVTECEGCDYTDFSIVVRKNICLRYRCPKVVWWREEKCPYATHIEQDE